ncbi:integrative conjugative element protein, RAQPRD family [Pseudomonas sp. PGPR40]|uniref:integrative conjugative element protein, RAQPRD family n=1 Tax=Pseudomonas sp. PGPR40 TaxID=2913476 RepID=UPI001ED9DC25|nr:RAQPRD family integrative conjugative element protein [Pseudomonas sp. PGPR40]
MINSQYPRTLQTALLLFALLGETTAAANEVSDEHIRLATLLRELNAIDRLAIPGDILSDQGSRYRFNYARLRADIHRVSTGIQHYLAPQRATPRDSIPLHGSYLDETGPTR